MERVKTIHYQGKDVIGVNTLEKWNKRGMSISTIKDTEIVFIARVFVQKLN